MPLEEILLFFAKYIEAQLGIIYANHNFFQLQNRLDEITRLMGADSIQKLYEQAQTGIHGQFKQLLLDTATNNETSFFRDPKVFRTIEAAVLPQIMSVNPAPPSLSIWSAASSSGQEALSITMLLLEWCKKNNKVIDFKITGTDISDRILAKARNAQYTQLEVQRGLPAPLMIKYFTKDQNDLWTANSDLTGRIDYKSLNLTENFQFKRPFDLIFCRNVLIYQSVERKINILNRIHSNLAPSGFLVLGSGESMIGLSQDFEPIVIDGAVLFRKKEKALKVA